MSTSENSPASYALFRAEVVNTDNFISKGYINVYIEGIDFEQTNTSDSVRNCLVLSQFGGLDRMGFITCPPIKSLGYVMFPNGDMNLDPVWMGSVNIPADKNTDKNEDAKYKLPKELSDPTEILLKTQYTKIDNEVLNGSSNKVENFIKLNEDSIILAKVRQDDYGQYDYERNDLLEQPVHSIQINNDSIILSFKQKGNQKIHSFELNDEGILITAENNKISFIKINENGITLNSGDKSTLNLSSDGIISIDAEQEIDLNGSSDNVTKWSGFNDFVDAYNNHTHGTPDGPSSDPNSKWNKAKSAQAEKVKCS